MKMTNIPSVMTSRCLLLRNMFDPEEYAILYLTIVLNLRYFFCRETEKDWDKELASEVKGECESKFGKVEALKVEVESQVCNMSLNCWFLADSSRLSG
jgi:RNA-binding protein 23/39